MRRRKLKKRVLYILIIIILIVGNILIYNKYYDVNLSKKQYSEKAIKIIEKEKIKNIYKKEYSKTLDIIIQNNKYNPIYLDEYLIIKYVDKKDFSTYVNKCLELGYDGKEINDIFKLSEKNQNKLLNYKHQNFSKYLNIKNFNFDNLERYDKYLEKTNKDIQTVVTYVNIELDIPAYENSKLVDNPDDISVIVNKHHHLNKDFVPKNLVVIFDSNRGAKLVKEAADQYKLFIEAAKKDGITLVSTTAYRDYKFQEYLYNTYVKTDGIKNADTYSARPGTSEHQLGLVVDLDDPNVKGKRLDDRDYKWVLENSYKYGFIVRYRKETEHITGYMEEPWHIRYLGIDLATKVYKSNLTYEEYNDLYVKEY